jgi:hypothetical protein
VSAFESDSFCPTVPASGSLTLKVEVEETDRVVCILAISFQESGLFLFAFRNAACSFLPPMI